MNCPSIKAQTNFLNDKSPTCLAEDPQTNQGMHAILDTADV
jgi:hypothetical protein